MNRAQRRAAARGKSVDETGAVSDRARQQAIRDKKQDTKTSRNGPSGMWGKR